MGDKQRLRGPFALGVSETSTTAVVTVMANSGLIFAYDGDTEGTGNIVVKMPVQEAIDENQSYDSVRVNKYGVVVAGVAGGSSVGFYQADWSVTDEDSRNFIRNKPTIPTIVAATKSKAVTVQTPTTGDEVVVMFGVKDATLLTLHAAVVGSTSVTVRLYESATLGSGTSGSPICSATTVTQAEGAKSIAIADANITAGNYVYMVITAVVGTPALVSVNLSYTGGE